MADMKVQVLIDLLYEPGKAQQAAKDLALIAEATEAADKNAKLLTADYDLAEQAASAFGSRLDTTADSAATAADAVLKAQEALSRVGSGFDMAGTGANAAATAFERTGEALAGLDGGKDPFARLDGSMIRAEGQARQLAATLKEIDGAGAPAGVPAGTGTADAALRAELKLAEEVRDALAAPATDGALAAVEATNAALKTTVDLAAEVDRALARPATDGALAAVEATNAALKTTVDLAAEVDRALARPATDGALAAVEATNAALKTTVDLAAEVDRALAVPATGGGEAAVAGVAAALRDEIKLADEARAALSAPATDGALAAVDATNAALKQQLTLEEEVRRLAGAPVAPAYRPPAAPALPVEATAPAGVAPIPSHAAEPSTPLPVYLPPSPLPPPLPPHEEPLPQPPHEEPPRKPEEPKSGGGMGGLLEGFVGFAEVGTGYKLAEGMIHQAGEAQTIDAHLRVAGVPEPEIAEMHRAAADISRDSKIYSANEAMELLKDGRAVLGSTEDAVKVAGDVTKLTTIAESMNPGHGKEGAFEIIKAAEAAGKTKNPQLFHDFIDDVAKNTEIFGDKVPLRNYREFYQHAGAAGQHVPREFTQGAMPHLLQEYGGDSVGTMYNMMDRAVVGGITNKKAMDSFRELGLVNEDKVHVDSKGHMRLDAGAIKGTDAPGFNPFTWANDVYEKAMDDHHLSKEEKEHHYQSDFSNSNVAGAVAKMTEQKEIIEKDARQIAAAHGLAGADDLRQQDPHLAHGGMMGQLGTFEKLAGDPLMARILPIQNALVDGMAKANEAMEKVPGAATAVGGGIIAGLGIAGWKTMEHGLWNTAKWAARGVGDYAGPVGLALGITDVMLNEADHAKALVHGGRPDRDAYMYPASELPGLENVPELQKPSERHHVRRGPRESIPYDLPDWRAVSPAVAAATAEPAPWAVPASAAETPAAPDPAAAVPEARLFAPPPPFRPAPDPAAALPDPRPPLVMPGHPSGEPIHVVIDGDRTAKPGPDAGRAGAPVPAPFASPPPFRPAPTGGTATPTLAQPAGPVTNNNQQTTTVTNTYHVSAPVTVNVAAPAAAPAAVGGAVAAAVTSAVKQSPGVLHDGYGPH